MTIEDQIIQLAQARARLADAKTREAAMLATITESEEYQALAYELKQAKAAEAAADAAVREEAKRIHAATANKKPHAGVQIKSNKVVKYDTLIALTWARTNLVEAVKLDEQLFTAHALAVSKTQPVPCVTIYEEYSASISRDLSEYLPDPEAQEMDLINFFAEVGDPEAKAEIIYPEGSE